MGINDTVTVVQGLPANHMVELTSEGIALRLAQKADLVFLCRLYASTRQGELGATDWDGAQIESFLRMQFDLQTRYYAQAFPTADTQVILRGGHPIGRLMIDRRRDRIHLVDISLLPEYRQAGIGTLLVKAVQDEAAATSKVVILHVASSSRARSLYQRLGFETCAGDEVYLEMRWPAQGVAP